MNITAEQYQRIIRFLDAEMELDEMNAFEKELDANSEMRKQLDFEQSLRDDLALQNITSLPDEVAESGTMIALATPGKLTGMRKWWAVGAAIVAVLALLSIFRSKPALTPDIANINEVDTAQQTDTMQNETEQPPIVIAEPAKDSAGTIDPVLLFKQYFEKDALPEQYPLFLAEALTDYESGNYKTLHQLDLNNLPQTRSAGEADNEENTLKLGHYYKGLAFLQTGNTREAITNLDWVLNHRPGKVLQPKAQWYLALAYLKENNGKKAAELCRNIVNNKENHSLVKNAEKILDGLGK